MAASLSRPDPSSPASVAEAGFSTARRGYQPDEVRAFLVAVAAELGRLQERERQLEAELADLRDGVVDGRGPLDEATATELLGEETVRVLQTARESASQIKIRAEETAARILREANDEVNRVRQEAEVDTARRRQEAAADAEAEVALAKQQGREMVNEARAYRERVLADLDRRTTLARKQIDELIHGRDRLLQVFERARLVAVDVTSELRDIDTPDELVNLTPTTGPVPIMVPNQRGGRPDDGADLGDDAVPAADDADVAPAADRADDTDDDAAADTAADIDEVGTADELDADRADDTNDERDATHAETADGTDDTDVDADHDAADGTDDEVDDETDTAAAPRHDANVVSLFRGRPAPVGADEPEADAAGDPVDGLFARLRDELPAETDTADTDEGVEADAPGTDEEGTDGEETDTAFTRRDEALVPLIVAAARKVKRALADEQNLVLDTLRRKEPVTELAHVVPSLEEHAATYLDAIGDELVAAAVAGAAELGVADNRTLRSRLGKAGALDDARSAVRIALITPLRDRLERSIADGDGDNEVIAKRVRAVYREWKTQHIDGQLDDVFRYAHGGGLAVSAEPGTPMVWTIDPTEPACPDCEDNSLSGAVPAGEPFATGHTTAPAHPGCRCLVLPQA